jgi:hypothetical protein
MGFEGEAHPTDASDGRRARGIADVRLVAVGVPEPVEEEVAGDVGVRHAIKVSTAACSP